MPTSVEWLDGHVDRLLREQQTRVDAAKLLSTFAAAVAAGMVGTALESGSAEPQIQWWAVGTFALAGVLAIAVIMMDRLIGPDHDAVLRDHAVRPMSDFELLTEFRRAALTAIEANEGTVRLVRVVATWQVTAAVTSAALATAWLVSSNGA